jgi:hypothetical protein
MIFGDFRPFSTVFAVFQYITRQYSALCTFFHRFWCNTRHFAPFSTSFGAILGTLHLFPLVLVQYSALCTFFYRFWCNTRHFAPFSTSFGAILGALHLFLPVLVQYSALCTFFYQFWCNTMNFIPLKTYTKKKRQPAKNPAFYLFEKFINQSLINFVNLFEI